ncbi:hypothetical protein HDU96_000256 [Phlyctochytrium bullatum]|nr:hypothetical protein HDU96_000256 [Phlyctochytrium bullatum]
MELDFDSVRWTNPEGPAVVDTDGAVDSAPSTVHRVTPRGPAKRSCDFCRHRKRKCDGTLRHCARAPPDAHRIPKKRGRPPKLRPLLATPPPPRHDLFELLDRVDIRHSFVEEDAVGSSGTGCPEPLRYGSPFGSA